MRHERRALWAVVVVGLLQVGLLQMGCSQSEPAAATSNDAGGEGPATRRTFVGTTYWDLDANDDRDRPSADLYWQHVDERHRYLVPINGAGAVVVAGRPFDQLDGNAARGLSYATKPLSASDIGSAVDAGTVIAVRTNENRYAKLKVVGFKPFDVSGQRIARYDMVLEYVIFAKDSP